MINCHDVAKYFLTIAEPDSGDLISNLKLQKLAYYVQGFNLAIYDKPMFSENIEAWMHGPVVPSLYNIYKTHEKEAIPPPIDYDDSIYSVHDKELLKDVHNVYGQFSAWKLRDMTHEEPPWKNTKNGGVIEHHIIKDYFKTLLIDS